MTIPLRAHRPDADHKQSPATFRVDDATIRLVLDWWEQNPAREVHSLVAEKERCRLYEICRADMGDELVNDSRPFHLLALINAQPRIKKNNTRRRWNTTLQQPFNEAELLGLIVKNPFRGLSFPEGDEGRDWTDDELSQVLRAANQPFSELIVGLRLSGLRPHEACDLRWPFIRRELGNIKIDKHKSRYRTKAPRLVPLNEPLIELFDLLKARNLSSPFVFLNTQRKPWTREHADSTFRRLRQKVGLADDLKLHGCRHTFGTGAVINNVEIMKVMQMMGHADIRTTQRYIHLANKTEHLTDASNQAVKGVKLLKAKAAEYTPLFDGLE